MSVNAGREIPSADLPTNIQSILRDKLLGSVETPAGTLPTPSSSRDIKLLSSRELLDLEPPGYLIDGVLPRGGLSILYSSPGTGKTFVAMSMALSVATGEDWLGRETEQGQVVYISAEGGGNMGTRLSAALLGREEQAAPDGLKWVNGAVCINDSKELEQLRSALATESPPKLIVIDTLARCMTGEENSAAIVAELLRGLDCIRDDPDAAILVVHHSGKDSNKRMRGSSALEGAADCVIKLSGTGALPRPLTLKVEKQKDGEETEVSCVLEQVSLPSGTTSCRIAGKTSREFEPGNDPAQKNAKQVCQVLASAFAEGCATSGELHDAVLKQTGLKKTRAKAALSKARELGWIHDKKQGKSTVNTLTPVAPFQQQRHGS